MPLQIEGRSQAHKLITSVVEEEGHADGYSHGAHHGDEGTFYKVKAGNAAHTGGYYDNRGDGGAAAHDGGCKVHGQQHQYGMQAGSGSYSWSQSRKGEEGSVTGAHNNSGAADNSNHNQHHSHRTEA